MFLSNNEYSAAGVAGITELWKVTYSCPYFVTDVGKRPPCMGVNQRIGPSHATVRPDVIERGCISPSLFVEMDFQRTLRTWYADPRLWKGVNVLVHEIQMDQWESRKALTRRIQGELLLRSEPKPWIHLWENREQCHCCYSNITNNQPVFEGFRCTNLVHQICLMENWISQKIPLCQACGVAASRANPPVQGERAPTTVDGQDAAIEETRRTYRWASRHWAERSLPKPCGRNSFGHRCNTVFNIIKHGYDHQEIHPVNFVRGPWVLCIAILVRSMARRWEIKPPVAVMGARFMLLFVGDLTPLGCCGPLRFSERQRNAFDLA